MSLTKSERETLREYWRYPEEKWDREALEKAIKRSDRIQRAMEERIEKKDRNAVERYLIAWAKQDRREIKRWERDFAKI
jgi:hypothetical protein